MNRYCVGPTMAVDWGEDEPPPAVRRAMMRRVLSYFAPPLLLRFLDALWSERLCGVAVSEFDPGRDHRDQSLSTLVWLLEYLLLKQYER